MSNNELLNKFRQLMGKKKNNDILVRANSSSEENTYSKNEKSEEDVNERPDKKDSEGNKISPVSINTYPESPQNDSKPTTIKTRPTVFNLAKRFERRDLMNEGSDQSSSPDKNVKSVVKNDYNTKDDFDSNLNSQNTDTNYINSNFVVPGDSADYKQRTSTNKALMKNALKKLNEDYNSNSSPVKENYNNVDNNPSEPEETYGTAQSSSSQEMDFSNYQSNITSKSAAQGGVVMDVPRISVRDMIKLNEKRLHSFDERKKQQERHSVTKDFRSNMSNIAAYLHDLKETSEDKIDSDEFLNKNSAKIKSKFGINEKEIPLVKELIGFFEKTAKESVKEKEKQKEREKEIKNNKTRNTVAFLNFKQLNLNIPKITEEKDEDNSVNESTRKSRNSNSVVERISGNIRPKNLYSKINISDKNEEVSSGSASFLSDANLDIDKDNLQEFAIEEDAKNKAEDVNPDNEKVNLSVNNIEEKVDQHVSVNEYNQAISFSVPQKQINRYSTFNNITIEEANQLLLKECGLSMLHSVWNKSLNITEDSFAVESSIKKKKHFINLDMNKQCTLIMKSKEKENLVISNKISEVNYITKRGRPKFAIQRVNNIEIKKIEKKIEIFKDKPVEIISNKSENLVHSNNMNVGKMFIEDTLQNEEHNIIRVKSNNTQDNIPSSRKPTAEMKPRATHTSIQLEENKLQIKNFLSSTNAASKYQKNIINSLDSISVAQYNINSSIPLDPIFFDVLCINCYECVKLNDLDLHSEMCIYHPEEMYKENTEEEEDYNARIYKLHESLKKKQVEIYKTNNEVLILIYEELTNLIYEILINNNSIEELDKSISQLNEIINNKLNTVASYYKFTLLIFCKRISQLVYVKLQDMEKVLLCVKNNKNFDDLNSDEEKELEEDYVEDEPEKEKQIQILKMELADLEKQTLNTKIEIEQWRKESKALENLLRKPNINPEMLSDIVSDVVSRRDESFDGLTMVTGQTSEYDTTDVANMKEINEVLDLNNEEELKKYFLSIGLSLKFKYAERITENASIADLYENAKESRIPISDWYSFICQQLKLN